MVLLPVLVLWLGSAPSSLAASDPALRRYPYLTDVVGSYATINWGTDRSQTSGAVRYGKAGSESCTAHFVPATKTAISVNGSLQYQWKAQLDLLPGTQYCYRVYLGSSPLTEIDLLGSDASPAFWTQMPMGAMQSFSFAVFGDWGYVNSSGTNSYQASVMSLIASSGARFAVTTGDNGYPGGSQKNYGDLVQTGADTSAVFGPSFWTVPGRSLPLFLSMGNHGLNISDTNHPSLLTWPQDRAVAMSGGRYTKDIYCCLNGTNSASYPSTWYAFDAGPARFYILHTAWTDSNSGTTTAYKNDYDYHWAPGTAQYQWLQADLAAHPSILKFAIFHYPLYSDNPNEAASPYLQGSNALEGLLKQNGVDIAFTGHAHIYERNLPSASGIYNYITGGGGATPGTLGTCTALDAYAIKFTTTGKACGSAPMPTSADQVYHFLKVTVNGTNVTVTPINSLGQSFDVRNYTFSADSETGPPTVPGNVNAAAVSGRQVDLSWSASSDNTGVRGYGVYRDGTLITTVDKNTLAYSDASLTPSTNYAYRVDAFDGSGNHSPLSTSKSVTTPSSATYTFGAIADAYVAANFATTNYGLSGTLKADASPDYRSYLRFHVNDLSGTVTNATLRLYTTSSSATGYQVNSVANQNWEESSITYANAPAVGSVIGSSGNFASGNWISVDVTSLVTGNGVYDLALTTTNPNNMNFNSRDAASNPPQLVIQTNAGAPPTATSTPLQTVTATQTASATPSQTATSISTVTSTGTATATPTVTPSQGSTGSTTTFTPIADSYIDAASPSSNYGSLTTLRVDASPDVRSYIRFNVQGLNGTITRATLRIFANSASSQGFRAHGLSDNSWSESAINYNNAPVLGAVLGSSGAATSNTWKTVDVTAYVTGNGAFNFGLSTTGSTALSLASRQSGANAPQLIIESSGSAATPTSTVTAANTFTATATQTPTSTPPSTNTATATPQFTATPTPTGSVPPTNTPTSTPTRTPTVTATQTGTGTASASSVTFLPLADSYVNSDSPTTNYGTLTTLRVDGSPTIRSYLRFTVQGLNGTVTKATLRIFANSASSSSLVASGVSDNTWTESTINYNNAPSLDSSLGTAGPVTAGAWISIDITAYITGDGTYNLAVTTPGSTAISLASRQSGANAPQLIIETSP